VTIASGRVIPIDLAISATHIYWLEAGPQHQGLEGALFRMAKTCGDAGCVEKIFGPGPGELGLFRPTALALGAEDICWLQHYEDRRSLWCMAFATGQKRILSNEHPWGQSLRVDGQDLFWVNAGTSQAASNGAVVALKRDAVTTTPVTTIAPGRPFPVGLTLDKTHVYWTELGVPDAGGEVRVLARDGGGARALAAGQGQPRAIAEYGAYVYWVSSAAGTVSRARKDGSGGPEVLVVDQKSAFDIAVDATGIYWMTLGLPPSYLDGRVMRADLDGKNVKPMAENLPSAASLAIDETYVYYATDGTEAGNYLDGAIHKVLKRF
jgi:hypothetical protein